MEDQPKKTQPLINNTTSSSSFSSTSSSSNNNNNNNNNNNKSGGPSETVRSRWTPKPEQILILESIFNSGMVNPPKEETVRIRKLLEKFGAVGDANVFYWFQNRRSRSRRRQRQLQASLAASTANPTPSPVFLGGGVGGSIEFYDYGNNSSNSSSNIITCTDSSNVVTTSFVSPCVFSGGVDDVFCGFTTGQSMNNNGINAHQLDHTSCSQTPSFLCPSHASNHDFQTGIITVFINGVATQVQEGPIDVKTMFGEEVILVHSSGVPVPLNDFGISFQALQHGESYFFVPRLT